MNGNTKVAHFKKQNSVLLTANAVIPLSKSSLFKLKKERSKN